jgi:hypothetical protein
VFFCISSFKIDNENIADFSILERESKASLRDFSNDFATSSAVC